MKTKKRNEKKLRLKKPNSPTPNQERKKQSKEKKTSSAVSAVRKIWRKLVTTMTRMYIRDKIYLPSTTATNVGGTQVSGDKLKFSLENIEIGDEPVKVEPKKTGPKKVEKPKKKPKYIASRYKKLPPTIVINKGIVNGVNNQFLRHRVKKLKITDCEIGEASMYMLEYYTAIDPLHPALVMIGAIMGVGLKVMELQSGEMTAKASEEASDFVGVT